MPSPHQFEHLPLVLRDKGPARLQGGGEVEPLTEEYRQNRASHSGDLGTAASGAIERWQNTREQRQREELPDIEAGIPLLIKIDPSLGMEDLRHSFEFEIVSEQEDGFVIVASKDISLTSFQQKLTDFIGSIRGSANVAKIHELRDDPSQLERLQRILSEILFEKWPNLVETEHYVCDVSIACVGNWQISNKPKRGRMKDQTWAHKEAEWSSERDEAYKKWETLKDDRIEAVRRIIEHYQGEILLNVDDLAVDVASLPDSFTLRIKLSGRGLKDLVLNYPYVFEVVEPDEIERPLHVSHGLGEMPSRPEIEPPVDGAPYVCVIDSGIQEEHYWLAPGIDRASSHCFLPNTSTPDVADHVRDGGHGTRVAGAVLYGANIPSSGVVQLETWIQNARILDADNALPEELFPPALLREIVERYHKDDRKTRIYNHSINARCACRTRHMSSWAAEIDRLSNECDVLVIQSAGNIPFSNHPPNPGISEFIANDCDYPDYLDEASCRIANPGQSFQALTVGSVAVDPYNDQNWRSLASLQGQPSGFSRSGFGIWDSIKPEVVEYGGDAMRDTGNPPSIATPDTARSSYPELLRTTLHGGPAYDRDNVGTSFAAPKVTRIAARLQSVLPDEPCLLYRALIVQSARWPGWADNLTAEERSVLLKKIGYGIPDIERATSNNDFRTTFITHQEREICAEECHVYQIPIPEQLSRPGADYDVLVEVTLSYSAEPRRTRRNKSGYLSVWLDWLSNKKGESRESFLTRALKSAGERVQEGSSFGWTLETRSNRGLPDVWRNRGTVQKDWAVVKSNALPEHFCIAVQGHKGWSRDPESVARYSMAVTFEILGKEISIYEPLRTALLELQSEIESEIELEVTEEAEE